MIYKYLDRANTVSREDFLISPVVKKVLIKIPYRDVNEYEKEHAITLLQYLSPVVRYC